MRKLSFARLRSGSFAKDENRNPAGAKLLRRFYRAKHGVRSTLAESARWYTVYNPHERA